MLTQGPAMTLRASPGSAHPVLCLATPGQPAGCAHRKRPSGQLGAKGRWERAPGHQGRAPRAADFGKELEGRMEWG